MVLDPDRLRFEALLMYHRHGRAASQMVVSRIVALTRSGGSRPEFGQLHALAILVDRAIADDLPGAANDRMSPLVEDLSQQYPITRLATSLAAFAELARRYSDSMGNESLSVFLGNENNAWLSEIARFDECYAVVEATPRAAPFHLADMLTLSEDALMALRVARQPALAAWQVDTALPQPILNIHPDLIHAKAMVMVARSANTAVLPVGKLEFEMLRSLNQPMAIEHLLGLWDPAPSCRSTLEVLCDAVGHETIIVA